MLYTTSDLHRSIELCPVSKELMSCPHVQRMKSLKQLGTSNNTYMSTNHTRFEHSLGVAWLAEQTLVHLQKQQPRLGITRKDILCVNLAGLLHDLGHGPFSVCMIESLQEVYGVSLYFIFSHHLFIISCTYYSTSLLSTCMMEYFASSSNMQN